MKKYLALLIIFTLTSCIPATALPTATSTIMFTPTPFQETSTPVQPTPQVTDTPTPSEVSTPGELAFSHIEAISNGIGIRAAGTGQEAQTAQYILGTLKKLGYPTETQPFTVTVKGNTIQSANVIAVKQGTSSQEIIVGAHYDSVQVGKGADDNASGIGVILEVAERIKDKPTPYTIRFVLFGAEEVGLQGSKYYVQQMLEEQKQNTVAMINLDSVTAGDVAYIYGDEGDKGRIRDWALQYSANHNLILQTQPGENPEYPAGTTGDWSDHAPFRKAGIPYTYFESTNWTLGDRDGYTQVDLQYGDKGEIWHTQYDTLEYINTTFPNRMQERLHLFVVLLEAILTDFQVQ
jgi:hypothetical protein